MAGHNLSTRPFYNERAVHWVLALVALVALGATAYNLARYRDLSGRHAVLQEGVARAERRAADLRARAATARASIDPGALRQTIARAGEANALIDARVFSWTQLFNHVEATLPANVRIASVRPQSGSRDAGMTLAIVVVAKNVEGISAFVETLEKTGAFAGLLSREEFAREDGAVQATLEGRYVPGAGRTASRRAARR